ncbi:hypothetical protein CR513_04404, partial [Mucuna pruriens]
MTYIILYQCLLQSHARQMPFGLPQRIKQIVEEKEISYHCMTIADPRYELLKEETSLWHNNRRMIRTDHVIIEASMPCHEPTIPKAQAIDEST